MDRIRPNAPLVEAKGLTKYFPVTAGFLFERKVADIKAVDGVSLSIAARETLGLVGESGSGKTTVGKCLLGLLRPSSGEIIFDGHDLAILRGREFRRLRRRMQPLYQDPYSALNPRLTVGAAIAEPIVAHRLARRAVLKERVFELLSLVGLAPEFVNRYPHMLSGGQRQRVGIARALAVEPSFLVCDEPVSALDVSIQAQIINTLVDLQEKLGLTYLLISHDLSVVRCVSHHIAVMYLGQVVELAENDELYQHAAHPYTKALLSAVPIPDPAIERTRQRHILTGEMPSPVNSPIGCRFHPRCHARIGRCGTEPPGLHDAGAGHWIRCHLAS